MKISHLLTALALSACFVPAAMAKGTSTRQPRLVKVHVSGKMKAAKRGGKIRKPTVKNAKKPTGEVA